MTLSDGVVGDSAALVGIARVMAGRRHFRQPDWAAEAASSLLARSRYRLGTHLITKSSDVRPRGRLSQKQQNPKILPAAEEKEKKKKKRKANGKKARLHEISRNSSNCAMRIESRFVLYKLLVRTAPRQTCKSITLSRIHHPRSHCRDMVMSTCFCVTPSV
jgi:hypothetical protein